MPSHRHEHSLPAVHALHLAQVAARWGVRGEELFAPLGIAAERLAAPGERLDVGVVARLVERAIARTGEPALGVYLGMQMRVSAHGYLGFAAMSAATVRGALELATRFAPTRTRALSIALHEAAGRAALVVSERADFGAARETVVTALLVGLWQIGVALTGRELEGEAELALPEPPYFQRFTRLLPRVRFERPAHQLVFDASVLDLPLTMADPAALHLAQAQCERELVALGGAQAASAQARALLPRSDDGAFRAVEELAAVMKLSPRTLKRRLAAEGTSYTALLEEAQRERALLLLRAPELSLEAVAERVGYSDVSNFARAFRRWTGVSPAAYRRGAATG